MSKLTREDKIEIFDEQKKDTEYWEIRKSNSIIL
jgi:hypothetical protein